MVRMNGIEFLKIAKGDDKLRRIPVVMLITSKGEQGRTDSFNPSVAGYIVKPTFYKQVVEMVRAINSCSTVSELPV